VLVPIGGLAADNHPSRNQEYSGYYKVPYLEAVSVRRDQNPNSEEKANGN